MRFKRSSFLIQKFFKQFYITFTIKNTDLKCKNKTQTLFIFNPKIFQTILISVFDEFHRTHRCSSQQ